MRPIKRPQGALAHPLNAILGAEANVRVLRVVLLSQIPIGITELARLAALQASGLPRICAKLEDLGIIESVGRGRTRQFRRSQRGDLGNSLANLFTQEQQRAAQVLDDIRRTVQGATAITRSAWIEGPVARDEDVSGDPIIVGALVDAAAVEDARQALWGQLLNIQQMRDVAIELRLYTEADLKTADAKQLAEFEGAQPLVGAPPFDIARPRAAHVPEKGARRPKRHEDTDAQLLRLAAAVANRIKTDQSLIESAMNFIDRRLLSASPGEQLELREWKGVLGTMSPARVRRLLVQDDARARRLRQSMPFLNVLSPVERERLLKR